MSDSSLVRTAAAAALAGLLGLGAERVAAAPSEDVESRMSSLLSDPAFQTELPAGGGDVGRSFDPTGGGERRSSEARVPGGRGRPLEEGGSRAEPSASSRSIGLSMPLGGGLIFQAFVYVLAAALLGALIFALARAFAQRRRLSTRLPEGEVPPEAGRRPPTPPPDDLDELLREGRYAEAAHVLLRRALAAIEERSGRRLAKSLTSREILDRGGLEHGDRETLATLVEAVERSLFGGLSMSRDDYDRCAGAFSRLSSGARLSNGGAAA